MNVLNAIRLLQEACALQHTALNTEKSYVQCLRHYARFLRGPQPELLTTEAKIEAFLTKLALQGVSASTQNQAFNALLFFYRYALKQELGNINALRAKLPATLRYCPDRAETLQLLNQVKYFHMAILTLSMQNAGHGSSPPGASVVTRGQTNSCAGAVTNRMSSDLLERRQIAVVCAT